MRKLNVKNNTQAQTAMEYLLILAVVGIIVLTSFRFFLPKVHDRSEDYYNTVTRVILGEKPQPVNGGWCEVECPSGGGVGNSRRYRTCECPSPAFGGQYCQGADFVDCPGISLPENQCVTIDGTCTAPPPTCGQVTIGQDNCGRTCTKQGPVCPH